MRTMIEMPDALFRRTKAKAALHGSTLKDYIIDAVLQKLDAESQPAKRDLSKLPVMRLKGGKKLDLTDFDFDDLLA